MDAANDPEHNGLETEEDVPVVDPNTLKPNLYQAAIANDTAQVLQYLDQNVPPTYIDARTGLTALHWAALNGNVLMVKRLLECNASNSYHEYKARLKKMAKIKSRRMNASNAARMTINTEDNNNGPVEESKDGIGLGDSVERVETNDEEEEEADDGDTFDVGPAVDMATDYSKNTPLLYATQAGHTRVVWLLLADGYSPNDVDKMDNNAVHLAAACGDVKLLQVLINDGGNAGAVNHYKNLPVDMAKNKAVRDIVLHAMEAGASLTEEDRAYKHEQNLKQYERMTNILVDTINEALNMKVSQASSPRLGSAGAPNNNNNKRMNKMLLDAIDLGKENALDAELIAQAEMLLKKLEVNQDLVEDIVALQRLAPIKTQTQYLKHVYKLEKSIERALEVDVDPSQIQIGLDLISRCQIEYWLATLLDRLKDVSTASDSNEHDMHKLRAAIQKAQALHADEEMIEQGTKFLGRLDAELGMFRALKAIPIIKMPMENPPEGYYTEQDVGKIKETEGFPLPPPEGEYVWIPAENLTKFIDSINRLKSVYTGAEAFGANPAIIAESKERIAKAEKELKVLEAKDNNDKLAAIEVTKKAAKKLKSKKHKGKK